jgi:hypothetical protein
LPSSSRICSRKPSAPCVSMASKVTPSTPGAPSFCLASAYASRSVSILQTWTYNPLDRRIMPQSLGYGEAEILRVGQLAVQGQDRVRPADGPRREPCDPGDDQSRRTWLARRPRASVGLSAGVSGCGFRWPDIRSGQQLLVHRPCDVGQDTGPIHNGLFAPIPVVAIAPKNVPDRLLHRYAGRQQLTILSAVLVFGPYGGEAS